MFVRYKDRLTAFFSILAIMLLIAPTFVGAEATEEQFPFSEDQEREFMAAVHLLREGKHTAGATAFDRIAKKYSGDVRVLRRIALHLRAFGKGRQGDIAPVPLLMRQAATYMKRAVELEPDNENYQLYYGLILHELPDKKPNDKKEALRQFQLALNRIDRARARNDAVVRDALTVFADVAISLGRHREGELELFKWLEPSGWNGEVYGLYIGTVARRSMVDAEKGADRYFQSYGFSEHVKVALCEAKLQQKRYQQANACFKELRDQSVNENGTDLF